MHNNDPQACIQAFFRPRSGPRRRAPDRPSRVVRCESLEPRIALTATAVAEIESNDSFATAQSLPAADHYVVSGGITSGADVDFFALRVTAGKLIAVNVRGLNPGDPPAQQFDPVIGLFSPSGQLVSQNDDTGTGSHWAGGLSYKATETGIWRVAISDYNDFDFNGSGGDGDGHGTDTGPYSLTISAKRQGDLVAKNIGWDSVRGGLQFTYAVREAALPAERAAKIEVFWATSTTAQSRIGTALFTLDARRAVGEYGPVHVPPARLANPPTGATHLVMVAEGNGLIAETSESNNVQAVADVRVSFGSNVRQLVSQQNLNLLKGFLREAGQARAVITSTLRLPADQARVMFDNLYHNTSPSYAAAGQQVIAVYRSMTRGLARPEILRQRVAIQNAMEAKILEVGPTRVSKHCNTEVGYAAYQVFDVGPGSSGFTPSSRRLFVTAVGRAVATRVVARFLHPGNSNDPAFHFEIGTPPT
jgi:hypothetical protein